MRLLVQGIGSIGQRHYKNARALGHDAAILRTSNAERPFVKDFFDAQRAKGNEPVVFYDLETAVREFNPRALIIGTPNHLHLSAALEGAKRNLHLLIEKPVHNAEGGLDDLVRAVSEKRLIAMVGYNLRFHPLLQRVKTMIQEDELGGILSAAVEVGENIIDWHPWEEYRETYAPWAKSGGGALLCFSHDIDYLYWLLGSPKEIFAGGGKVTPLEGDAEDLVQGLWKFDDGRTATLHIDYWSRPKFRTLKIVGTKKTVLWDAYANLTIWDHETGTQTIKELPAGFERNTMFLDELRNFVDAIEGRAQPHISLHDGIEVVRLVNRIKEAL